MAGEEAEASAAAAQTLSLKEEAQAELDLVLPVLSAAEAALNALNKNDIVEIRTFSKPPALVQLTLEGVCILLQVGLGVLRCSCCQNQGCVVQYSCGGDAECLGSRSCRQLCRRRRRRQTGRPPSACWATAASSGGWWSLTRITSATGCCARCSALSPTPRSRPSWWAARRAPGRCPLCCRLDWPSACWWKNLCGATFCRS
jgi:hypothetical protein